MTDTKFKRGKQRHLKAGRKKGTPNKFTDLKKAFLEAFDELGGTKGLVAWAKESKRNKAMFYQMITKLFPINVKHEGKIEHDLKFDFGENGE